MPAMVQLVTNDQSHRGEGGTPLWTISHRWVAMVDSMTTPSCFQETDRASGKNADLVICRNHSLAGDCNGDAYCPFVVAVCREQNETGM